MGESLNVGNGWGTISQSSAVSVNLRKTREEKMLNEVSYDGNVIFWGVSLNHFI